MKFLVKSVTGRYEHLSLIYVYFDLISQPDPESAVFCWHIPPVCDEDLLLSFLQCISDVLHVRFSVHKPETHNTVHVTPETCHTWNTSHLYTRTIIKSTGLNEIPAECLSSQKQHCDPLGLVSVVTRVCNFS